MGNVKAADETGDVGVADLTHSSRESSSLRESLCRVGSSLSEGEFSCRTPAYLRNPVNYANTIHAVK